jgi:hypothetical protein
MIACGLFNNLVKAINMKFTMQVSNLTESHEILYITEGKMRIVVLWVVAPYSLAHDESFSGNPVAFIFREGVEDSQES